MGRSIIRHLIGESTGTVTFPYEHVDPSTEEVIPLTVTVWYSESYHPDEVQGIEHELRAAATSDGKPYPVESLNDSQVFDALCHELATRRSENSHSHYHHENLQASDAESIQFRMSQRCKELNILVSNLPVTSYHGALVGELYSIDAQLGKLIERFKLLPGR